jgi:hypothetical protein
MTFQEEVGTFEVVIAVVALIYLIPSCTLLKLKKSEEDETLNSVRISKQNKTKTTVAKLRHAPECLQCT